MKNKLSDKFITNLLDHLPQLISYVDKNLCYVYVNETYESWMRLSKNEIIGKSIQEILTTQSLHMTMPYVTQVLLGKEVSFETYLSYKDGQTRYVQAILKPIFDDNSENSKEVLGFLTVIQDLSHAKAMEAQYRQLFHNVPIGLAQSDSELHILQTNQAFQNWIGYSAEELQSMTIPKITHPEDLEKTKVHIENIQKQNSKVQKYEKRFIHKTGKELWGRVSSRQFPSENPSEGAFAFSVIEDICDIKMIQDQYEQQKKLSDVHFEALNAFAIVATTDLRGNITYANDKFCQISGYSESELIGKNHRILNSGFHPKEFFEEMWKTILAGQVWRGEVCNRNKLGGLYWVDAAIVPLKNIKNEIYQFIVIRYEITARKQMERVFQNNLQWQTAILNGSDFSIIATDLDGIITTFNRSAEHMLGYSSKEMVGKVSPAIFHDLQEVIQKAAELSKELKRPIEPGFDVFIQKTNNHGTNINEWTYIRKDGSRFPVRLCLTPIYDEMNQPIGYLGIAEDLTQQKKLLATIEAQRLQMISSAKMSTLGEMAGGVAHEINNPLAVIKGKAEQILKRMSSGNLDPIKLKTDIQKIEETSLRITKIIQGLRSFSRQADDDPMTLTSINEIIEETTELCIEKLKNHGIQLIVNIPENISIECRTAQISQVLMNLLNNSFDAIEHLDSKWIRIDTTIENQTALLSVTDSGSGIPKHVQEKIMQPFFTTKEVGKGTGLGLSISQGIASSHGGQLEYDPTSDHTKFTLKLPLKQAQKIIFKKSS